VEVYSSLQQLVLGNWFYDTVQIQVGSDIVATPAFLTVTMNGIYHANFNCQVDSGNLPGSTLQFFVNGIGQGQVAPAKPGQAVAIDLLMSLNAGDVLAVQSSFVGPLLLDPPCTLSLVEIH
jgi:hypothetical protein